MTHISRRANNLEIKFIETKKERNFREDKITYVILYSDKYLANIFDILRTGDSYWPKLTTVTINRLAFRTSAIWQLFTFFIHIIIQN